MPLVHRLLWVAVLVCAVGALRCGGGLEVGGSEAPYDAWTFIEVPEALCANGSPVGFGINPHRGSTGLVIYLQGGGACWDYATCIASPRAANLHGWNKSGLAGAVATNDVFDRGDPGNPFREDNFVFVPYCTGDVHFGDRETSYSGDAGTYTAHHVGYANVGAYLERLTAAFPSLERVVVSGSSAGGYGATANFDRIRTSFPTARAYLIDDSGPLLRPPYATNAWYSAVANAWGIAANLPAGCPQCDPAYPDGGLFELYPYYAQDPDFRGALLATTRDSVISGFCALPPGDPECICYADGGGPCLYEQGLSDLHQNVIAPSGPGAMRVFFIDATFHVFLPNMRAAASNGVPLEPWIRDELADGGWSDVTP